MKKDWTYKKLGEVGEVIGGTTPSTSNPAFWNGDLCWISPAELHGEHYLYDSVKKITREAVKAKSLKRLPVGTVILSSRAPIGKLAINKVPMYCNQGFKCVVCGKELYNEYLYWWFYFKKDYLNSLGTGATFPEISKSVVENIEIPLPPLSEQSRIVSRLDAAFGEIEGLKAKAEAQLSEARTLFQAALTKEMKPKQGWEEKKLKEIGTTQTGTTPSKNDKDNYGDFIPFIRPSEIDYDGCGGLKYDSEIKLSEKGLSNGRLFKAGSILMVCIGATISKVGVTSEDVSCNQQINVLKPKQEYDSKFIYYAMRNEDFKQKVIKEGTSSQATLPIINKGKWENLSLSLPPLPVQQSIVSRLDALSEKVRELEEAQKKVIAECDALKQALLREVFE
ncbi:MAG: restriction endonuclease subunit S [Bacteroidaceae bacterium]|nr:restriction endonuclease subunit S [Bacteroidaceae bacterium]